VLVLDEADEMLDHGFSQQIYDVFQFVPGDIQVCLFSATMTSGTTDIASKFLRDPIRIRLKQTEINLSGIHQFYVDVQRDHWKFDVLCDIYDTLTISQAMIFVGTRRKAEELAEQLTQADHTVSFMHGDMPQQDRSLVMQEFRSGSSRILLCTDVGARGLDVRGVSMVINFDLPRDKATYIHRVGRAGRYGRKGVAINFVTERDVHQLRDIEAFYGIQIEEMPDTVADLL